MTIRKKYVEYENNILASYAMHGADTRGRVHPEPALEYRSPFQRDHDRIMHSNAFRRMTYKTQVFVFHESDHYRTRLTHTIEVTQIGRSLARALFLSEDLTESIGLAHDLGHTPFGHAGEEALNELLKDHGGFEHNRHSLRVVDFLEERYPGFKGLNLTWEVREGIAKHHSSYDNPDISGFEPTQRPTLEAQLINIADAIAYNNHDLDDGLRSGITSIEQLEAIPIWAETYHSVLETVNSSNTMSDLRRVQHQTINTMINDQISDTILTTEANLEQHDIKTVDDVRQAGIDLVTMSPEMQRRVKTLQEFLYRNLYFHPQVVRMCEKAKRIIRKIFNAYLSNPKQLPKTFQERLGNEDVYRTIADYIAGMTDRFAQDEYQKLFFPLERV